MALFPRVGGPGLNLNILNQVTNLITLQAGEVFVLPSNEYMVAPGPYTSLQFFDPIGQRWVTIDAANTLKPYVVDSDGTNFRLANLTGCPVGANVTAGGNGTSLTNGIGTAATGLTVTVSTGNSTWVPVVGGAVNPTVTVSAGGSNYQYPPNLQFSPPPTGGVQASGYALIASNTVSSVVVVNQGAGYTSAPSITAINDARDTQGSGASFTVNPTLIGNTQVTALYPSNPGTALTAVPTLTFAPTSAITATVLMNFTVTGLSGVGGGGAFAGSPIIIGLAAPTVPNSGRITAGIAGPIMDVGLTQQRPAFLIDTLNGAALTTTAAIVDAGFGFQAVPTANVLGGAGSTGTTIGSATFTVGGTVDTSYVQPV